MKPNTSSSGLLFVGLLAGVAGLIVWSELRSKRR